MTTKQLREMLRQAEVLEQNPQNKRKESATLITQTEPIARTAKTIPTKFTFDNFSLKTRIPISAEVTTTPIFANGNTIVLSHPVVTNTFNRKYKLK